MPKSGTPYQTGGGGHHFEQYVQAAFLTTMMVRGNAPCLPSNEIKELAFQASRKGWETDDLYVLAESAFGKHQFLSQIKSNVIFSAENEVFRKIIRDFWKDFQQNGFNRDRDRLVIIKNRLTTAEKNQIKWLFNAARMHSSASDFLSEVERIGEKRDRLGMFLTILKEANDGEALSELEVWQFLRCMDLLGYDFLQVGSVDETYALNLIKLARNSGSTATEKEIWDGVLALVSKYNPSGGSFTLNQLQREEVYRHFDVGRLAPYFQTVQKLHSDGEAILQTIKTRIGPGSDGVHLERKEVAMCVADSINNFPFTIVTGKPGVGKSALVHGLLDDQYQIGKFFVFRAFQFNQPVLANVFGAQGVHDPLKGVFSAIALIPDKIIFVDSLENLLEDLDPNNAFKQFISFLAESYPDVKVVGTCRRYAVDLLVQRFALEEGAFKVVEVPPLTGTEVEVIVNRYPQLRNAVKNGKIQELLETPKYIEFALTAISKGAADFSGNSIIEFKDELWNRLVKNYTVRAGGLPTRREDVFVALAGARAREMVLFVRPISLDVEVVEMLENDGLIIQDRNSGKYAPAHDILEDWALIRYVHTKYESSTPQSFFADLGNEPAIRRAFRLWVSERLQEGTEEVFDLAGFVLNGGVTDRYWSDELLTAIFKADDCAVFFRRFKQWLSADRKLSNRCIHLLRTACKERLEIGRGKVVFVPVGAGWREMLCLLAENKALVEALPQSVFFLLLDWEVLNRNQMDSGPEEVGAAAELIEIYVQQMERPAGNWRQIFTGAFRESMIGMYFRLAKMTKESIRALVYRAIQAEKDEGTADEDGWYAAVLGQCLVGYGHQLLIIELPEVVMQVALFRWKSGTGDHRQAEPGLTKGIYVPHGGGCWGLVDEAAKEPPGAYRTPVFEMLFYHPEVGLRFVINFLNEAVSFYQQGDCDTKLDLVEVDLLLNEGRMRKQWGCGQFWSTYRGESVTNYLLASILIGLEKYLLLIAGNKTEESRVRLRWALRTMLTESNNILTTAVVASVSMAFPVEVGEELLPVLTVREFYEWDISRALDEHTRLNWGMDDEEPAFVRAERRRSNELPHRKKYQRGWVDFVVEYQFNIRVANEKIHAIFDILKAAAPADDLGWLKLLTEMDIRDHRLSEIDGKRGSYIIQPVYSPAVQTMVDAGKDRLGLHDESLTYYAQVMKVYKGEAQWTFESWEACYRYYRGIASDFHYDKPLLLAVIGLRDFNQSVSAKQREWCHGKLLGVYSAVLEEGRGVVGGVEREYRLMEKEVALKSFHLLLADFRDEKARNELLAMAVSLLSFHLAEHEIPDTTRYMRTECYKKYSADCKRVLLALVRLANYEKLHPRSWYGKTPAQIAREQEERWTAIQQSLTTSSRDLAMNGVSFETHDPRILVTTLLCTPQDTSDGELGELAMLICRLYLTHLLLQYDRSAGMRSSPSWSQSSNTRVRHYLAEYLYTADHKSAKEIVTLLFGLVKVGDVRVGRFSRNEPQQFVRDCLSQTITGLDRFVAEEGDEEIKTASVARFWAIWEHVYEGVVADGFSYLEPVVLLDIQWKEDAIEWAPFVQGRALYERMVAGLGEKNFRAVLKVLSTTGDRSFLPQALRWIGDILRRHRGNDIFTASPAAEQLIRRLFYRHLLAIGKDRRLVEDFLYLLDLMIELGSSQAYFIRENVITFKGRV